MGSLRLIKRLKPSFNLKITTRNVSVDATNSLEEVNEQESYNTGHIYYNRLSKSDLKKFLIENIVYHKDGIMVTNKPFGVGNLGPQSIQTENFRPHTFNDHFLQNILPEVAHDLGLSHLKLIKCPKRYASGVTILETEENAGKVITDGIVKMRQLVRNTFLVVTLGRPDTDVLKARFGIKRINNNKNSFFKVVKEWSKNSVKKNEVKQVDWNHEVLAHSKYASLVKVQLRKLTWDCLTLIFATKLYSPVLGDPVYSRRVKKIMGVPMASDPDKFIEVDQELDPELLSALQISQVEAKIIPSHVHFWSADFPIGKRESFFVSVQPPESFIWSCNKLGINIKEVLGCHSLA